MKIAKLLFFIFVGIAVPLGSLVAGCNSSSGGGGGGEDSGATQGTSAAGESCTRTADCMSGLACIQNSCYAKAGASGDGGADAEDATVDGGGGEGSSVIGPRVGQVGDSCQTSKDCAASLECVASASGFGVCNLVNYGLTPTGKTCAGECTAASDCCELPLNVYLYACSSLSCFNYVAIHTCQDILQLVLGGDTSVCAAGRDAGSTVGIGCFYYQTYCQCAPNTWACNGGTCAYTAPCSSSLANEPGGCPSLSRARAQLPTACDPTTNKCQVTTGSCASATECNDAGVADIPATCRGGDCTCYQSGCYIKCTRDLDCQGGYSCDMTRNLCVQGSCTKDQECATQLNNVRAKCQNGTCRVACATDHDCSPPGGSGQGNFNGTVCDPANKFCVPVGCTADIDCAASSGNVRTFCVTTPDAGTVAVHSAITN
jgi:hypothetical protein